MSTITPELARRILWESAAVEQKFPGRFRLSQSERGLWSWEGEVLVEGQAVPIRITYPPGYPGTPPVLETLLTLPVHCPHLLGRAEGRTALCWIAPKARHPLRRWDPQRHTAATVMRAAQRWFLAYLVWQTLKTWPVPDAFDVPLN